MKQYKSLVDLLSAFPDEATCIKHLEKTRWPKGIICPCCGSSRKIYNVSRDHTYKCGDCKKQFSVRKGTIFEESRLPLQKWFAAMWLVTNSPKGISSCQLKREIGVTQKTAWFMLGRLREVAGSMGDLGGPMDGTVEADETYLGGKRKNMSNAKRKALKKAGAGRGTVGKQAVAGLRDRSGRVRVMMAPNTEKKTLQGFVRRNVARGSNIFTDEHRSYLGLNQWYNHKSVCHSVSEYVKGQVHTNGIESFWALLKRGYYGVFHHFTWKHLHRYLGEFETRWNMADLDGNQRMDKLLGHVSGNRLTYQELIK